jgi:hypothetical protein
MKIPFATFFNRITGISTPIAGVSWTPPVAEHQVVTRLVTFLEDRRVLYNPYEMEIVSHCISSILEIRHRLTEELECLDSNSELHATIAAIRASCRKFLDTVERKNIIHGSRFYHDLSMADQFVFGSALGELRGAVGVHLAFMAAKYQVDVEEQLVSIFPLPLSSGESKVNDDSRF